MLVRLVAWVKSKTVALGHHSPYCVDEHGQALNVQHLATELGWHRKNAEAALREACQKGLVRVDQQRRIWLCANVPASAPGAEMGEQNAKERSMYILQPYIRAQVEKLPPERRQAFERWYPEFASCAKKLEADAIAAARGIVEQYQVTAFSAFGVKLRTGKKRRPEAPATVRLELAEIPAPLRPPPAIEETAKPEYVHTPVPDPVQTPIEGLYNAKSQSVQAPASLYDSDSDSDRGSVSVSQSTPVGADDRPTDKTPLANRQEEIRTGLQPLCEALQEQPTPTLLERSDEQLRGAPLDRLWQRVQARRRTVHSLGIVACFAADVGRLWQDQTAVTTAQDDHAAQLESRRRDAEDVLSNPFAGAEETAQARAVLPDFEPEPQIIRGRIDRALTSAFHHLAENKAPGWVEKARETIQVCRGIAPDLVEQHEAEYHRLRRKGKARVGE